MGQISVGANTREPLHQNDVVLRGTRRKAQARQRLAFASAAGGVSGYPSGYLDRMGSEATRWVVMKRAHVKHDLQPTRRSRQAPQAGAEPLRTWCCAHRS